MDLIKDLQARGLVEDSSAPIEKIFNDERVVYIGTDPTADSLHVGHLVWVILLKRLAEHGHKPILLVGGGTGMIGDPKEKGERSLLDENTIDKNAEALRSQLERLIGVDSGFTMVNNADWLREVKLLPFLRDVGKLFTVNDLVKRDLIKRRLETPDESISYTEFTYSLLQAYDYWELNQRFNCDLQIGASDQWTNILSGVDLIRKREGKEVFALSIPLVTDASGRKFGKSEGNAVWLDAEKTTPYNFYQFWLNVEDEKVIPYLKLYTMLSLEEIDSIEQEQMANPGARVAQRKLAADVTALVHGEESAVAAEKVSQLLFGGVTMADLSEIEKEVLVQNAPQYNLSGDNNVVEVLVETGLASSKREAREFVEAGAVSLNEAKITEVDTEVVIDGLAVLRRGKKNLVVLVG